MPDPTVYIIAEPGKHRQFDYSALGQFGTITFVLSRQIHPTNMPSAAMDLIDARLADFDHRHDFVTWLGGDALAAIMAGVALSDLPYFNYLRYDRAFDKETGERLNEGYYTPVSVQIQHSNDLEEELPYDIGA